MHISSLVWHYNRTSYLDGYEGRRAYVLRCSLGWLNIGCDGVRIMGCHMDILCFYANMHFEMAYGILDTSYACLLHSHALPSEYLDISLYYCTIRLI